MSKTMRPFCHLNISNWFKFHLRDFRVESTRLIMFPKFQLIEIFLKQISFYALRRRLEAISPLNLLSVLKNRIFDLYRMNFFDRPLTQLRGLFLFMFGFMWKFWNTTFEPCLIKDASLAKISMLVFCICILKMIF